VSYQLLDASARFGVQRQLFAMRVDEDVGIERDHLGSSWTREVGAFAQRHRSIFPRV
jgi:hypothetical protein